jgi:hypothetical protein
VTENATVEARKTVNDRVSWAAGKLGTQRMLIGTKIARRERIHTPKEEKKNT